MIRFRGVFQIGATLLLAAAMALCDAEPAAAQQYGNTFWYRDPRTGQTYGFRTSYGRYGTNSTLFYGRPGFRYQSANGFGNGHVWGGYGYQTPYYGGGMRWRR